MQQAAGAEWCALCACRLFYQLAEENKKKKAAKDAKKTKWVHL